MRQHVLCLAIACMAAIVSAPSSAAPLEVFTSENQLAGWKGLGLRDAEGRVVLQPAPYRLTPLKGGGFLQGGEHGGARVIDAQGQPVGGVYDSIQIVDPELDVMILGAGGHPVLEGTGGLIDVHGNVVVEPTYPSLTYLDGTGLFAFERARRFGALDSRGNIVLPATYDGISVIGGAVVVAKRGEVGVFDHHGKTLAPLGSTVQYLKIEDRPDRLLVCARHADAPMTDTCRVVDPRLEQVLPGQYRTVTYLAESRRWLVSPVAKVPEDEDAYTVGDDGRAFELLEEGGQLVASFTATRVEPSGQLLIVATQDPDNSYRSLYGLMDQSGRWLAPAQHRRLDLLGTGWGSIRVGAESESEYVVTVPGDTQGGGDRWGVIDSHGREVLAPVYDQVLSRYPGLGLYVVKQDKMLGVVDGRGAWRIPPTHDRMAPNSNLPLPYLMLVKPDPETPGSRSDSLYVLYDMVTGKPVFKDAYKYIDVHDSYWPHHLKGISREEFTIVTAKRGDKYGVLDLGGNVIQPFVYDNLNSPDRWGRFIRYRDGQRAGEVIDGLDPARRARLHEAVSRQIRAEHAPLPSAAAPHAGRYVATNYDTADKVSAAVASGQLSRPYAPMLLLDSDTAILDLGMVSSSDEDAIDYLEYYCPRGDGFDILMPGADQSSHACRQNPASPALVFRATGDGDLECGTCADFGLPAEWRRTDPVPLLP